MGESRVAPGFGERIRRLRDERGWTQADLAERASISQVQVSRLEAGVQTDPRLVTLTGLADAFGLSIDALTGYRAGRQRMAG